MEAIYFLVSEIFPGVLSVLVQLLLIQTLFSVQFLYQNEGHLILYPVI